MKVILCKVGLKPMIREIDQNLETYQKLVGGFIEVVRIGPKDFIVCNEEGKIKGLPLNFDLGHDVICGDFFIVGDNGVGDFEDTNFSVGDVYAIGRFIPEVESKIVVNVPVPFGGIASEIVMMPIEIKFSELPSELLNGSLLNIVRSANRVASDAFIELKKRKRK